MSANAINAYAREKETLDQAERWVEMLGKPYSGGGGGVGCLHGVAVVVSAQMYYQPYDGASNYHNCPPALAVLVGRPMALQADRFVREAIREMRASVERAAALAVAEHDELMRAAGLSAPAATGTRP